MQKKPEVDVKSEKTAKSALKPKEPQKEKNIKAEKRFRYKEDEVKTRHLFINKESRDYEVEVMDSVLPIVDENIAPGYTKD